VLCLINVIALSCDDHYHENGPENGPWEFITHAELAGMGLANHDATMPLIRLGENDYWIYLSEGGATDGKHSHIIRARASLEGVDISSFEEVPVYGIPDAGINDLNGWKAWMMNLYEIDADEWLAVLHYEDQDAGSRECFRMGVAYSNDTAKSFTHLGFILKTDLADSIIKSGICSSLINIAGTGMRWDDEYLYVYFSDMNEPDRSDRHIAVARAEKNTVIENARKGLNTSWFKYYNGEWNEPGLGGHSQSLGTLGDYHTTMMYNNHINKWVLINAIGRSINLRRSADPLDFNVPDELVYNIPQGARVAYSTIQPHQENMHACGKEFYIYYRYWYKEQGKTIYDTHRLKIILD
jgi:hypothetical protein